MADGPAIASGVTRHLVVFAKAPIMGRVKTRLAAEIGPVTATHFYRQTLAALMCRLGADPRWRLWLSVTPDAAARAAGLWAAGAALRPQGPGGLGARMARVLAPPLGKDSLPPGPAVLIGSDIPAIRSHHIAAAFAALGRHRLVFGPAADGGFWLVASRRSRHQHVRGLFRHVRWSTKYALADTLANIAEGDRPALLETLTDIDDGHAYWEASARSSRRSTRSSL